MLRIKSHVKSAVVRGKVILKHHPDWTEQNRFITALVKLALPCSCSSPRTRRMSRWPVRKRVRRRGQLGGREGGVGYGGRNGKAESGEKP